MQLKKQLEEMQLNEATTYDKKRLTVQMNT